MWTLGAGRDEFDRARAALGPGPAVLRDYVKSAKHHWDEAVFIPELADGDAAWRVATRFQQVRDDDFVGGFVLRAFERFTSAEARTWWVNGRCVHVSAHPDTPNHAPGEVDVASVAAVVAELALPFVTLDLARRDDGVWRVIALGDGQVSDRPSTMAAATLVTLICVSERPGF